MYLSPFFSFFFFFPLLFNIVKFGFSQIVWEKGTYPVLQSSFFSQEILPIEIKNQTYNIYDKGLLD